MIMMQILWAPWRMDYIVASKAKNCIFCEKAKKGDDVKNLILFRGELVFALLNIYPYNHSHLMIAPYRHLDGLEKLSAEELLELMRLAQWSLVILASALKAEGFNLGINQGKVAGAGIEEHVHMHVVPRWGGDTSFMPILGNTRVIPEPLESTYAKLCPLFRGEPR